MTRNEIEVKILKTLEEDFEVENPDKEASLVEIYEFDSVDAVNLLGSIEEIFELDQPLTIQEEREAMKLFLNNCTINQLVSYIEELIKTKKG